MSILIFIIILLVLVLVHESGHFFTAKKFRIRVDEFGFGFPPKLFGIKKGETEYTFNLLPLGGFVKIYGENPDEENTSGPDAKRSFVNKPKYEQALVLGAGVLANFLLAWLLFSFGLMSGLPTSVGSEPAGYKLDNVFLTVVSVMPKSPAELSGLRIGDKIIQITTENSTVVNPSVGQLKSFVVANGNKQIQIDYLRGEKNYAEYNKELQAGHDNTKYAIMTPVINKETGEPAIGISMDEIGTAKLPFFAALIEGMRLNWYTTKNTAIGLYTLIKDGIHGKGSLSSVTGPVGMVGIVGDAYRFGFVYLVSFAALISVNLAIINLLPFPALDGGRLFFLLVEKIKGSRMNPKVVNTANMIGFCLLLFLMLIITYHDVAHLF